MPIEYWVTSLSIATVVSLILIYIRFFNARRLNHEERMSGVEFRIRENEDYFNNWLLKIRDRFDTVEGGVEILKSDVRMILMKMLDEKNKSQNLINNEQENQTKNPSLDNNNNNCHKFLIAYCFYHLSLFLRLSIPFFPDLFPMLDSY